MSEQLSAASGGPEKPMRPARPEIYHDARFEAAMSHMHRGEWAAAISGLEALAAQYPGDRALVEAVEEARFKSDFDAQIKVRPKRWAYPWMRLVARLAVVAMLLLLLWQGTVIAARGIAPIFSEARAQTARMQLLATATAALQTGELDAAEVVYRQLLEREPGNAEATQGLALIAEERALDVRYREIVALQEAGDCAGALVAFGEFSVRRSDYRDVNARVKECTRMLRTDELVRVADTHFQLGLPASALENYRQINAIDPSFQRDHVAGRIAEIELGIGRNLLDQLPATPEQLRAAQLHFRAGLRMIPRNAQLLEEDRLASAYLDGSEAVVKQQWDRAMRLLLPAYQLRPAYLGGALVNPLYDAYLGLGDQRQGEGDCALAYEQYRKAAALPVADATAANARLEQSIACLTPTPTPTETPLPTVPPPPAATTTPTPTPLPLAIFRGQIVFKSANPEQPGFWAMNPDGNNRVFIGGVNDKSLQQQFEALLERYRLSPDGQYRLYVGSVDGRAQVVMDLPRHPVHGELPDKPITRLTGIAYDPTWAPDGSWIAFVAQENESDDIWLIRPDGSGQKGLMRNDWEWDKHPSWSPDSTQLAFYSNREGTKGIYVMDMTGQNPRNISNVPWDEYDPIWIR